MEEPPKDVPEPTAQLDDLDDALTAVSAVFSVGAAGSALMAPPVALGLGVGAGLAQVIQLVRNRFRRRASEVAAGMRERLVLGEPEAVRRLTESEELSTLAYQAIDASLLAHHGEQAVALGRVVGDALEERGGVTVDEASIVIEALRALDLPHFIALRALATAGEQGWRLTVGAALETQDDAVIHGVAAGLARAGAVELDPPAFGGFALTPLGRCILAYITSDDEAS